MGQSKTVQRIIRSTKAHAVIGLGQTQFKALRRTDPTFPKPIPLGARARGFLLEEIDAWLAARAAERDAA